MRTIKNDMLARFDVDKTIIFSRSELPPGFDFERNKPIIVTTSKSTAQVWPHLEHIEKLKEHKARGQHVVVWSAGGWEWAEAVVKALGLEEFVDDVEPKGQWWWDDLPKDKICKERCYIPMGQQYDEEQQCPKIPF